MKLNQSIKGMLGLACRLVASKNHDSPPPVIKIHTSDSVRLPLEERLVLHGTGEQTEAIRVSDSERISSSADLNNFGAVGQIVMINKGRTPQNEEGGEEVCRTLIERLNLNDYTIDSTTLQQVKNQNDDTDFIAKNGNVEIRFQVTRAAPTPNFWHSLALFRKQDHKWTSAESCVEGIRMTIEQKARKIATISQRGRIILAICVTNSPALALNETIKMFHRKHGTWAYSLKFGSIWVVGPTSSLTHCVSVSPKT